MKFNIESESLRNHGKEANTRQSDLPVLFPYPRIYPGQQYASKDIVRAPADPKAMQSNMRKLQHPLYYPSTADISSQAICVISSVRTPAGGSRKLTLMLLRDAGCRWALRPGDAVRDRKDRLSSVADCGISNVLPRAPEAHILLT